MTEYSLVPNPSIKIRDEACYDLPLRFFDLLILVEPDPETWMVNVEEKNSHAEVWEEILELIDQEFFWEADDIEKVEYDPSMQKTAQAAQ